MRFLLEYSQELLQVSFQKKYLYRFSQRFLDSLQEIFQRSHAAIYSNFRRNYS